MIVAAVVDHDDQGPLRLFWVIEGGSQDFG